MTGDAPYPPVKSEIKPKPTPKPTPGPTPGPKPISEKCKPDSPTIPAECAKELYPDGMYIIPFFKKSKVDSDPSYIQIIFK
jgi:hypothetical protein